MTIYDLPYKYHCFTGEKIVKSKDFNKAKCPICKKLMTYEHNIFDIEFACENKKCKGYFRWLGNQRKTMWGDMYIKEVRS